MTSGACGIPSLALCNPHSLSLSIPRCIMDLEQVVSESLQSQGPQRPPGEGLFQWGCSVSPTLGAQAPNLEGFWN